MTRGAVELTPSVRNEVSEQKWKRLLADSQGATVFHSSEWAQALEATFRDITIKYIVIEDQFERYVAGMPIAVNRNLLVFTYRSMPFGTYGGPLIVKGLEEEAAVFVGVALQGLTRGLFPFSLSCVLYDCPVVVERALQNAFLTGKRERLSTHLIDLEPGFQKLWDSSFDKETRTCARKAARCGLSVVEDTTPRGVEVLHALYKKQAVLWKLKRIYPERLLSEILDHMDGNVRIWLGELGGRSLCAVLTFYFGDTVTAWLSGQNEEGRKLRASHLVYSEIMKHACKKGFSSFNFGASGNLHGVRYFKESFGAREHFYSVFTCESEVFKFMRRLKGAAIGT
jgi:CelD/BcsL family acetyltransferase involved in cellulose biosynthesis